MRQRLQMNIADRAGKAGAVCLLVAAALASLAGVSCGNHDESRGAPASNTTFGNPAGKVVDAATAGSVAGTVKFDGTPPAMKSIAMIAVAYCAKQHDGPVTSEDVVPGDNGTLQNVVVYLTGDFSTYSFKQPAEQAELDQKGCQYVPHVVAVMAGAPLEFRSFDNTPHNIHPVPKANREWNESQPRGGLPIMQTFAHEEVAIPFKCNLHPWMKAYVAVIGNPYFQVTGKDGSFELKNVPPGTYTLTAWHELYGTSKQTITINPKQAQTATITFHTQQQ
jgi:plastocyanin